MTAKAHDTWLPVASLLLAATLWGVIWYPLRLLEARGLAGLWAAALVYAGPMAAGLLIYRRSLAQLAAFPGWSLVLALAAGWCNVSFFLAVLEGTIVRVLLLFYLSPVWAALLARVLLGEHLGRGMVWVLGLAMAGMVVMTWDPALGAPWPRDYADWLAVSSGFTFALSNVAVRRMQEVSIRAKTIASWVGVVGVAVIWIAWSGTAPPPLDPVIVTGALALGLGGIVVMTVSVQYGVTHMPVHRSAVILLFELVAGAVSSHWLAHEVVRPAEWVGGIMILLAAWLTARRQQ